MYNGSITEHHVDIPLLNKCQPVLVACIFLGCFDHVQAELSDVEKDVVVKALNPEANAQDMSCAYTETIHRHIPTDSEEEAPYETIVGRFDPILRPESPWQVLSIDGRIPTEEAEYFQPAPFFHPVVHIGFGYSHIEDLSIVARHDETWEIENTILEYVEIPKELTPKTPQIPKGATLTAPVEIKTTFQVHVPTASLMAVRVDHKNAILPSMIGSQTRWVYMYEEKVGSMVVMENSFEMRYYSKNEEVQSLGSTRRVFSDFDCRNESPAEYQSETTRE